jgi:RNA polymerase sigma-70 factor (ECF subfamily)
VPTKSEQDIVAQLRARQKEALNYLYDHYSGALFGVVARIVKNHDVAEEVLQDVYLKIWERIEQYDATKGRLFTWMLNIARNQAIDKSRSKEINKERKTDEIENLVSKIDVRQFGETVIEPIGLTEVLASLQEDQRLVVEYLYLKGYTQSELAEEHQIPLGTVKTRLRMAMTELRLLLKEN